LSLRPIEKKRKKYSKHLILKIGILYPGSKHMTCMLCLYYEVYAAKMSETFGGI
jgi:hypothetical protein